MSDHKKISTSPPNRPRDFRATMKLSGVLAAQLSAADRAANPAPPGTFSGLAYDGGPVDQWWGRAIVDLEGIAAADQSLPLLLEHGYAPGGSHNDLNIGFVERMAVEAGGLMVAGKLLSKESAQEVAKDAGEGYPWQLSIRAVPLRTEQVAAGASAVVNGRTVAGPIEIYRECVIREVSVTHVGAALRTRLQIAASAIGAEEDDSSNEETPMTVNIKDITADWLKANKKEVYDQIVKDAKASDADGAAPVPETKASLPELKHIFAGNSELVLKALEAGATLGAARQMQIDAQAAVIKDLTQKNTDLAARLDAKTAAGGANPLPEAGGKKPDVSASSKYPGATGVDPQRDWEACAELRASWEAKCGGNKHAAQRAFLAFAAEQQASKDSYLAS